MTKKELIDFDPNNKDHMIHYAKYLKYGKWESCNYRVEPPFFNVPTMVQYKVLQKAMKKYIDKV